jgi:hypothetical protein
MDPLSIATAATALASFAFRASKGIYSCVDDIKSADANLLQLQSEVDALSTGLGSIASTFLSKEVVELCQDTSKNPLQSVKLLVSVKPLLNDCEVTLKKLDVVLGGIEGKQGRVPRLFQQPVMALKLNMKSKDIDLIRHQIRSYSSAMQMTLHMVGM